MAIEYAIYFLFLLCFNQKIAGQIENSTSVFGENSEEENFRVRKCCVENELFNLTTKRCSVPPQGYSFNLSFHVIVHVSENEICSEGKFKVKIGNDFLITNGILIWDELQFQTEDFCLAPTGNRTFAVVCVVNDDTIKDRPVEAIG